MRRLLNLNQPGTLFVKGIGFFMVLLPAVLYGILRLGSATGPFRTLLLSLIRISFVAGVIVSVVFLMLIVAEQIQDHAFDVRYRKQQSQKVPLANGYYECQYCGNQRVRENDRACNVCGKELISVQSGRSHGA